MNDWSVDDSRNTYSLKRWAEGYVDINDDGHLLVRPYKKQQQGEINLHTLVSEIEAQDIALPVLIRFQDILKDRVNTLCHAFAAAFKHHDYAARYTAVYPIKVNQQYTVVEEIINHGKEQVGLEAGSKPELMAVLSLAQPDRHTVICNGYKDREYIRLALIAQKLGLSIYIVLEKMSELALVFEEAEKMAIDPALGLRLKLSSMGKGKWQNTGGEKAKFGLTAEQILEVTAQLKQRQKTHWVKLLHFHMGSQIANLADIKNGLAEAAQYFSELHRLGINIEVLDIGGGMGVDYEGSESSGEFSVNYHAEEYADAVVKCFADCCQQKNISQPDIITESGRAMTAHHAVLVTDVVNVERHDEIEFSWQGNHDCKILQRAYSLYEDSEKSDPVLIHQQINALYQQAQTDYLNQQLSIEQRAALEKIYLATSLRLKKNLEHEKAEQQQLLNDINEKLADKMVCNLSVFQSVPDVWGIDQVFPIMPLQKLNQRPDRRAIVQDLTCDSDGQIEKYVDRYGIETTLPVHAVEDNEKYLLGIFMVGAYQEILGDMHNLFGDTNTINVRLKNDGSHQLCDFEAGDSIRELLEYVHFNAVKMTTTFSKLIESSNLAANEKNQFLTELNHGLDGYTYMED